MQQKYSWGLSVMFAKLLEEVVKLHHEPHLAGRGLPSLTWAQGRWGGFHGPAGLVTRMGAGMSTFVCHGVWLLETQTGFPFRFPQEDGRRGDRVLCVGCVTALPCGCGRGINGFPFISVPFDLKYLANDQGISG